MAQFGGKWYKETMNGSESEHVRVDVLRARRIEIEGADGSTRVELGTSDRGDAVVRLRDARGIVRAVVAVQDNMPRLRLLDSSGQVRLSGMLRGDDPGIELLGSDGKPRMVLSLREHEGSSPDLYFIDKNGEPRFGVALDRDGRVTLAYEDDAGHLHEAHWAETKDDIEDEPLL